jgi:hypothetical protein
VRRMLDFGKEERDECEKVMRRKAVDAFQTLIMRRDEKVREAMTMAEFLGKVKVGNPQRVLFWIVCWMMLRSSWRFMRRLWKDYLG